MMQVKFVERNAIDDKRWNGKIHYSPYGMPYAYTWYLDNVCEEWNGLILGDYNAVMPIVHARKWSFDYVFQPFFVQQLGIFTDMPISEGMTAAFFNAIPSKYKYTEMCIHEQSIVPKDFVVQERENYVLELRQEYELIQKGYSGNLLRNLRKAQKANLQYHTQLKPEEFVDFYMENTAPKIDGFSDYHKYAMLRFIHKALFYSVGILCAVVNEEKKIVAADFLLVHPTRTINLLPTSSQEGRDKSAMHFLLDTVIKIGAGKQQYLDFEGSMIAGIAKFYQSFGAEKRTYFHIKQNNLPYLARIFKK
ncbi:MAG: hypothetical protein ACPG4Z_00560 [Chitinophagales bacterium]